MELVKDYIKKYGRCIDSNILKVDQFLNHQIDPNLMNEIGKAFADYFKDKNITKVITIESSGIAPAIMTALYLKVPMVFVKKALPSTMNEAYHTKVISFTKNKTYDLMIDKKMLKESDRILFIDDFLANGEAFKAIEEISQNAKVDIVGVGIVIDKVFQAGHKYIEEKNYDLYSLAKIKKISKTEIEFDN